MDEKRLRTTSFETVLDTGLAMEFVMDKDAAAETCQDIIDYRFDDLSLLHRALTHSSVAPSRAQSYERLEFLGDAVLGMTICSALYDKPEEMPEGEMTKIKSTVVSRKTCAAVVRNLSLETLMLLNGDMADPDQIPESICAGLFESIVGAMYIDGGFAPAEGFILRQMQPFIEEALATEHQENYKSLLQQHTQRRSSDVPEYLVLDEQGPDHSKCFEVGVRIGGRNFPGAWGKSKKEAEQVAAKQALIELKLLKD